MARRAAGHLFGDPSIRAAVITNLQRLRDAMPGVFADRLAAAVDGKSTLRFRTDTLGRALVAADHPRWREFTLDADRTASRCWELRPDDVLVEVPSSEEAPR